MDRISNLPDDILHHVLSFLYTKEAATTSLLSKRWRNLFVFSPNLRFEYTDFVNPIPDFDILVSFRKSLERVVAVSGSSSLKNISLKCLKYGNLLSRGVLELPLEVFTCKTLVTMKLMEFVVPIVPENASLPSLKTLCLDHIQFSDCAFEILLSACSVIEELEMHHVESEDLKHCTLSSRTLKRLTLNEFGPKSLTSDTPSLAYLKYYSFRQKVYPHVNLDSLVEADLDLVSYVHRNSNPENNLIKGLRNVRILNLGTARTMETFYNFREAIPVFENLFHLSVPTVDNECCLALPLLLKNAPNLETLVIQGPLLDKYGIELGSIFDCLSGVCLLTCPVKVLKINMYRDTDLEMEQLKYFLEKLTCLELVKIRSWAIDEKECLQFTKDLLKLPRSSECKIKLELIPFR